MSEKIRQKEGLGTKIFWTMMNPIAGCSSPVYMQLPWQKVKAEAFDDTDPFIEFSKDPKASRWFPRLWTKAGVLAIPAASLEEAQAEHPELSPAVAYLSDRSVIRAAQLPEGVGFAKDPNLPDTLAIAGRIGPGVLKIMAGLWAPGRPFVQTEDTNYHPDSVVIIDSLAERFNNQPVLV